MLVTIKCCANELYLSKVQSFHILPASAHAQPSPLRTPVPRGTVLGLLSLNGHTIVSQMVCFALELIFDVHALTLDSCIVTYTHHCRIIWSTFTALKVIG